MLHFSTTAVYRVMPGAVDRSDRDPAPPGLTPYRTAWPHAALLFLHPDQPYIAISDLPKIGSLKRLLSQFYRADPMLAAAAPPMN
ncbi:MAG TPA: hypothetical protein VJ770_11730 [Stellaceae bacterium]|nr:hypothetical protein [Stellaceae bacterium]